MLIKNDRLHRYVVIAITVEFPKSENLKEPKVDFINNRMGKNE